MTLKEFNALRIEQRKKYLFDCCASATWAEKLSKKNSFKNENELIETAIYIWYNQCSTSDWLEAFSHHPKIGDLKSLTKKFASKEQSSIKTATAKTIKLLADANKEYGAKFGFIFIVCATGKSAAEMLQLLESRLTNNIGEELHVAMGEQMKITILRIQKLLSNSQLNFLQSSQLTTHVLDTTLGKPGAGINIRLQIPVNGNWQTIAQGITNSDGRIGDMLPPQKLLKAGNYKLVFDIGNYFALQKIKNFYPEIEIQFIIKDETHYHVPLLMNPFGYSTYRGS